MNITKISKSKSEIISPSKSIIVISANYQPEYLYNLLLKNPKLINIKDKKSETFLSYAIKRKNETLSKLILTFPLLDLNYKDSKGNSYLHLSVINQLINITKLLIKAGINLNTQNNEGNTPLHFAYNNNNLKIISFLIKNNAKLDIQNNKGIIPEKIEFNSLNNELDNSFDDFCYKSIYNNNNTLDKNITIQLNNTNNTYNNTNNTKLNETNKNSFRYSLVNFSYSEDEEDVKEEEKKEETSDIFNLTSSITYKEKMKNVSNINSHTIGEHHNIILDNNNINNNSKNENGFFEYSTSVSKEEKDLIQKPYLSNNINIKNKINNKDIININSSYNNYLEQDFIFSPFVTIKESIDEQNCSNIHINNNINKINISNKYEDSLYLFLSEINLEKKYYNLMYSNGFEDIECLIEQEKVSNASNISNKTSITDSELKEIGILLPGDRAKILIHLEEKAQNFCFPIPKNVYYICNDINRIKDDINIKKMYNWLKEIKVENYIDNFIEGGYYSIELILMQMNCKNQINDEIIRDELGIIKVGHRARIINKLVEDGRKFLNKLKRKETIVGNGEMNNNCDCIAF